MDLEHQYINYLLYNKNKMLEYSYIDYKMNLKETEEGLGIYTGIIHKKWVPPHIKPEATEYMKYFYIESQIPSYTRIGNNTLDC